MIVLTSIAFFVLLVVTVLALWAHANDRAQASRVWDTLAAAREVDPPRYDPALVAEMPEIAQRYFNRAIEPGTLLHRVVQLEMSGSFILNGNEMPMTARQILAPPADGLVWQAEIGTGLMRFAGSDGYLCSNGQEESWTKFWLRGLIPLARIGGTEDHARAAATRVMMESIWAPATLLPQFGAQWTQTGPDSAEIRFDDAPQLEPLKIIFNQEGDPVEIVSLRWSDANPEKVYKLQPFGGRMQEFESHQGFRIPVRVELGNLYGTPDYQPFFLATIHRVEN